MQAPHGTGEEKPGGGALPGCRGEKGLRVGQTKILNRQNKGGPMKKEREHASRKFPKAPEKNENHPSQSVEGGGGGGPKCRGNITSHCKEQVPRERKTI